MRRWVVVLTMVAGFLAVTGKASALTVYELKTASKNTVVSFDCYEPSMKTAISITHEIPAGKRIYNATLDTHVPYSVHYGGSYVRFDIATRDYCEFTGGALIEAFDSTLYYSQPKNIRLKVSALKRIDGDMMSKKISDAWDFIGPGTGLEHHSCRVTGRGRTGVCRSKWWVGDAVYKTRSRYRLRTSTRRSFMIIGRVRVVWIDSYCQAARLKQRCIHHRRMRYKRGNVLPPNYRFRPPSSPWG